MSCKLRLMGVPEEISRFEDFLRKHSDEVKLLEVSDQYKNRGKSEFVREYIEVEISTEGN